MPEKESVKTLEEEIAALEEKLTARKRQEALGSNETAREEKEVFRDVLQEHVERAREHVERETPSAPSPFPPLQPAAGKNKTDDLKEQGHREQVEALVEIALTKGILEAVAVARHLGNPHLLDDFHDMLVDEYYEKLLQAREITP